MVVDCWEGVPRLGNDYAFIGKKYISIGMKPFGKAHS